MKQQSSITVSRLLTEENKHMFLSFPFAANKRIFVVCRFLFSKNKRKLAISICGIPETWRHGHGFMETWRNRVMEMEARKHGNMETWRHGNMETWRHGYMVTWTSRHQMENGSPSDFP